MHVVRSLAAMLPLMMLLASGASLGHSPVEPADGGSLETATHVDEPAKSWAIYGHLDGAGDTWYFEMDLEAGDRLYLSLLSTEEDFVPDLVVMGPGWEPQANTSLHVDVPDGYGWVMVEGQRAEAEFEPFTPGSYYHVAEFDEEVPEAGTYYAAVHVEVGEGPFSLAVGYVESFTVGEWLSLPVSLIGVYRWEGQGWGTIMGPAVVVIVVGLAIILWNARRAGEPLTVFQWTSAVSGLFVNSWAAIVLAQMGMALGRSGWTGVALVTLGFATASIAMGIYALTPILRGPAVPERWRRMGMVVVGAISLFLYTGLYVGPVLAFVAALLPTGMAGTTPGARLRGGGGPVTGGS